MAKDFDLIICNLSNALFETATIGENLELLRNKDAIEYIKHHYGVATEGDLISAAYEDWRCCFPMTIAQGDGSLPRTPSVKLVDDENWFGIDGLESRLKREIERFPRP